MKKYIFTILTILLINSCTAVGVPKTSDPLQKLKYADALLEKGRAFPAERLIREAMTICKKNNNSMCLGEAYSSYAYFFRSSAVERHQKRYRERDFWDGSTYDNRYNQSIKYYKKSIFEFSKKDNDDILANTYAMFARTYALAKKKKLGCQSYDKSILYNKKFFKKKPNAKISLPRGFSSFEEFIKSEKIRLKCPM